MCVLVNLFFLINLFFSYQLLHEAALNNSLASISIQKLDLFRGGITFFPFLAVCK